MGLFDFARDIGKKIFGKVTLITRIKCTHDAKVYGKVLAIISNKNITRMHIRMEKAVSKNLGEKYLDTRACQFFQIDLFFP